MHFTCVGVKGPQLSLAHASLPGVELHELVFGCEVRSGTLGVAPVTLGLWCPRAHKKLTCLSSAQCCLRAASDAQAYLLACTDALIPDTCLHMPL